MNEESKENVLVLNDVLFPSSIDHLEEDIGDVLLSPTLTKPNIKKIAKKVIKKSRAINIFKKKKGGDKKSKWDEELSKKQLKTVTVRHPVKKRKSNKNYIRTTKYTFITFLPLCIFMQLFKLSNLYFIAVMCFNLIPGVSPIFPLTSILPVVYIFGATLIKEGIEDLARLRADLKANGKKVEVYDEKEKKFVPRKTAHIMTGDIVRLREDTEVPCDMLILYSPKKESSCYITTANLDGETNLKKRQGVYIFSGHGDDAQQKKPKTRIRRRNRKMFSLSTTKEESKFLKKTMNRKYEIELEENTENLDQMKGKIEYEDPHIVHTKTNLEEEGGQSEIEMAEFVPGSLDFWRRHHIYEEEEGEGEGEREEFRTPVIFRIINEKWKKKQKKKEQFEEGDEDEEMENLNISSSPSPSSKEEEEEEEEGESDKNNNNSSSSSDIQEEEEGGGEEEYESESESEEKSGEEESESEFSEETKSTEFIKIEPPKVIYEFKKKKKEEEEEEEELDFPLPDSIFDQEEEEEEEEEQIDKDQELSTFHGKHFNINNFLLRGVYLRITPYVIGIACYSGKKTKLFRNLKKSKTKWGILDIKMNYHIISLLVAQQLLIVLGVILSYYYQKTVAQESWYLEEIPTVKTTEWYFLITGWMTILIVIEVFIPMSLFVTIQVIISAQAILMQFAIKHEGKKMVVKTSNLNFDLAHMDIVFSDKTGTLTENKMEYSKVFIFDEVYTREVNISDCIREGLESQFDLLKQQQLEILQQQQQQQEEEEEENFSINNDIKSKSPLKLQQFDPDKLDMSLRNHLVKKKEYLDLFLLNLILNNTVTPHRNEKDGTLIKYDGPSSDEVSLVSQCAHESEYIIKERLSNRMECLIRGEEVVYKVLDVIPFNSKRKRSSVFVQRMLTDEEEELENGNEIPVNNVHPIFLFCKGADNILLNRSENSTTTSMRNNIINIVDNFSYEGLRTLVLGYKVLTKGQFVDFHRRYSHAKSQIQNQSKAMEEVSDQMERSFLLLGATAIVDELQEGVPEAVSYLRNAGLQVWILTGDKTETAINIGYQSSVMEKGKHAEIRLTSKSYKKDVFILKNRLIRLVKYFRNPVMFLKENKIEIFKSTTSNDKDEDEEDYNDEDSNHQKVSEDKDKKNESSVKEEEEDPPQLPEKYAVIVDNGSLDDIMSSKRLKHLFIGVIKHCDSVLCCRVTPIQKAIVTGIVQKQLKKRGVAIGDGANDVAMIQKAYVGVGIMGNEGSQAARASDYALPKFKYIVDLLAVQGRYCYLRSSDCVLVSLYKNFMYAFTSYVYLFFNLFTGQILFDSWIYQTYNLVFHSLPPLLFGCFEKDLPEDLIKRCPSLYPSLRRKNPYFNRKMLYYWYIISTYQSFVHFFSVYFAASHTNLLGGYQSSEDIFMYGHVVMTGMMVTMYITYSIHTKSWTYLHIPVYFGSLVLYISWVTIDSNYRSFFFITDFYYIAINPYDKLFFYILITFNVVAAVLPIFVIRYFWQKFYPSNAQKVLSKGRKNVLEMQDSEIREVVRPQKERMKLEDERRRERRRKRRLKRKLEQEKMKSKIIHDDEESQEDNFFEEDEEDEEGEEEEEEEEEEEDTKKE